MEGLSDDSIEDIAVKLKISVQVTSNVCSLLSGGHQLPYICHYKKDQIVGLDYETVALIEEKWKALRSLQSVAKEALQSINQTTNDQDLGVLISSCKDIIFLKDLSNSFMTNSSNNIISLPLESAAVDILNSNDVNIKALVDPTVEGVSNYSHMMRSLTTTIIKKISERSEIQEFILQICNSKDKLRIKTKKIDSNDLPHPQLRIFKEFFDKTYSLATIKTHELKFVKTAEYLHFVTVTCEIDENIEKEFEKLADEHYINKSKDDLKALLILTSNAAFHLDIKPRILRMISQYVHELFENNFLKEIKLNLLNILNVSNQKFGNVIGVEPIPNGFNFAIINKKGDVIGTGSVILSPVPTLTNSSEYSKMKNLIFKNSCNHVAINNGEGHKNIVRFFCCHLKVKTFPPLVSYSMILQKGINELIISEYSNKELFHIERHFRGAVSIARRFQDPLMELIKVDPKLFVCDKTHYEGISHMQINEGLHEVVKHCVSNVGVDVNFCDLKPLTCIPGIDDNEATKIIEKRQGIHHFKNRNQLKEIMSEELFETAAGFLRINHDNFEKKENTSRGDSNISKRRKITVQTYVTLNEDFNEEEHKFDKTLLHPNTYDTAARILDRRGIKDDIGSTSFVLAISRITDTDIQRYSEEFHVDPFVLKEVIETLRCHDETCENQRVSIPPIIRDDIKELKTIRPGEILTGWISEMTSCGFVVDVGCEQNGMLLFNSIPIEQPELCCGLKIIVNVLKVDSQHLNLEFVSRHNI